MQMTRISIPVSIEEREALRLLSQQQTRDPRDQARHILRQALGLTNDASTARQTERQPSITRATPEVIQ